MEKKIDYISRDYADNKTELLKFTKEYYPDLLRNLDDASIGSWFIDLVSLIGDDLHFYLDRSFQDTQLENTQSKEIIYSMARNSGINIPGKKPSITEVQFTCELPISINGDEPDWNYAPIIKSGTQLTGADNVKFEVLEDIDFSVQFNSEGVSDRIIEVGRNSNGIINRYIIKKTTIVTSGETRIYKKTLQDSDITPFMEVLLLENNVLYIESLLFKEGTDLRIIPDENEYLYDTEYFISKIDSKPTWKYFEVEKLVDQKRFGDVVDSNLKPLGGYVKINDSGDTFTYVVKGEWKPIKQKFITERTNNGFTKLIFGAGNQFVSDFSDASDYAKNRMSQIINNDYLGVLPRGNWTMFVKYKVGGGEKTNISKGSLTTISNLKYILNGDINRLNDGQLKSNVKNSIKVINTTAAVSGKNEPTIEEIRNMIKYNNGSQKRCVVIDDYYDRIYKLPSKYGSPFRFGVIEDSNKIKIYLLGVDGNGKLTKDMSNVFIDNLTTYLANYRMINDYIELSQGKICNLSFEVDAITDKSVNKTSIIKSIIDTVISFMDIKNHKMGEDIYVNDLYKKIGDLYGVISIIDIRVFNNIGGIYSTDTVKQSLVQDSNQIDLDSSDGILYSSTDSMFEIFQPGSDIKIRIKSR